MGGIHLRSGGVVGDKYCRNEKTCGNKKTWRLVTLDSLH
jgi:hypothetical protein